MESVCWGNSTVGSNPTLSAIQSAQLASPPHRAQECANPRRSPRRTERNRTAENRPFSSSDSIRPSSLRDVVPRSGFKTCLGAGSNTCFPEARPMRCGGPCLARAPSVSTRTQYTSAYCSSWHDPAVAGRDQVSASSQNDRDQPESFLEMDLADQRSAIR